MKFQKFDDVKSRLDLLPSDAMEIVGYVARHGGLKYEEANWRKCKNPNQYIRPILTHTYKHLKGEYTDKESGLLHLAHAVLSGLFAIDLFLKLGETRPMERSKFSYFALIERKSKKRGVVKKRFRSFEKAWEYQTAEGLDPLKVLIKTVTPKDKVGAIVNL